MSNTIDAIRPRLAHDEQIYTVSIRTDRFDFKTMGDVLASELTARDALLLALQQANRVQTEQFTAVDIWYLKLQIVWDRTTEQKTTRAGRQTAVTLSLRDPWFNAQTALPRLFRFSRSKVWRGLLPADQTTVDPGSPGWTPESFLGQFAQS